MSQEKVTLKLKNSELIEKVNQYYDDFNKMRNIGKFYMQYFEDKNYKNVQSVYTTNYTEGYDELVGFRCPSPESEHKDYVEIFDSVLNTFKRGKTYQPLRKNKHNKIATNDFTELKVSYTPILKVIYGDKETLVFEETDGVPNIRVKSFNASMNNGDFIVTVERRDLTEHTLKNFEEI